MTDRTIIAIASDTAWDYSLHMPVACLFWRDLIGHEPRAHLIGTEDEWQRDPVARAGLAALREHAIDHVFIPAFGESRTANIAQSIRQHAAADMTIPDDAWVMTVDADMWPLHREFFRHHDGRPERLVSYFGDGDCFQGKEAALAGWAANVAFQSIPSCYFTMRARQWRALYGYTGGAAESLRHTFETVREPLLTTSPDRSPSSVAWYFDQYYATERVCRQEWFPREALLIGGAGVRRGHLAAWSEGAKWEGGGVNPAWLDMHIRKGAYAEGRWRALLDVIAEFLPARLDWARAYYEAAAKAGGV